MNRNKQAKFARLLTVFFLWIYQFVNISLSQAQNSAIVNEASSQKIEWPYQLTFLHEIPKNKVDSLVIDLLNFSDREENGIQKNKIIEKIARTKTKEAFYLLFVACIAQPRADNYFPPFQQLCQTIKNHGGLMLLNHYFLRECVEESGLEKDFEKEVLEKCKKLIPELYYYKNLPREINLESIQDEIVQFKKDNVICKSPALLTKKDVHKLQEVYELTFLHEQPTTTVDSCVKFLIDSVRWSVQRNWHSLMDSVLDRLGQTKSTEALQLLYLASWNEINSSNQGLYSLTSLINYKVDKYLYKYYYTGKKLNRDSIGDFVFRDKVLANINNSAPDIYFCDQPTLFQLYSSKAHSGNVEGYDKSIRKKIKKSSHKFNGFKSLDLENAIRQLPFVYDVKVGDCYGVLDVLSTLVFTRVYTKIIDGDRIIERVYSLKNRRFFYLGVKVGKFRYGRFIQWRSKKWKFAGAYSYPALDQVKKYCDDEAKNRHSRQLQIGN